MLDEFLDIEDCDKELGYSSNHDFSETSLSKPLGDSSSIEEKIFFTSTLYDRIVDTSVLFFLFFTACLISFFLPLGMLIFSELIGELILALSH